MVVAGLSLVRHGFLGFTEGGSTLGARRLNVNQKFMLSHFTASGLGRLAFGTEMMAAVAMKDFHQSLLQQGFAVHGPHMRGA